MIYCSHLNKELKGAECIRCEFKEISHGRFRTGTKCKYRQVNNDFTRSIEKQGDGNMVLDEEKIIGKTVVDTKREAKVHTENVKGEPLSEEIPYEEVTLFFEDGTKLIIDSMADPDSGEYVSELYIRTE